MGQLENLFRQGNKAFRNAKETGERFFYNQSKDIFTEIVNTYPDIPLGFINLGSVMSAIGRHEEAVEIYTKSLQIESSLNTDNLKSLTFFNRGISNFKLDRIEESMNDYESSIELDANNYVAHYNLGFVKMKEKLFLDALDCYKLSVKSDNKAISEASIKNIDHVSRNMETFLRHTACTSFDESQKIHNQN